MPKRSRGQVNFDQDDILIREMEKKLKLKKRKKIPKSFYEEGLGDILELVDSFSGSSNIGSKNKNKKPVTDPFSDDEKNETSDQEIASDNNDDGSIGEAESSDQEEQQPETEEGILAALKRHRENKAKSEKGQKNRTQKDLYGFETGTANKEVKTMISQSAPTENKDLIRRIRGQLNRLTVSSLPSISTLIEEIYSKNSLFAVNESICKVISDLIIIDVTLSPLSLVSEMSLLLATLHENVGEEVGGHAVNYFVKMFDNLLNQESNDEDESSKKLDNVVALISYIYAAGLLEAGLFIEIIGRLINKFNAKAIELLMFILTAVGFIIRKESPELMKQLIVDVQNKANSVKSGDFCKRIEFMLETLTEIKNNNILKVTSKSSGVVSPISKDELRNILKNSLKRSSKVTPLRGSYNQVISSNRWWVKVGGLIEQSNLDENTSAATNDKKETNPSGVFDLADQFVLENEREEKICRALRLNTTAIRRSLFKAIITSSDYVEASDRLVAMCRKNQAAEAANVLIQIAIHEKTLNMFYVYTLKRLSNFDRRYKFSIFLALKDRLKDLSGLSSGKRNTLATLIVELLKVNVISLAVLKVFDFASITEDTLKMELMKQVLSLVMSQEEEVMKSIFDSIPRKEHQLVASIKYFISCFLEEGSSKTRDLLLAKMKLAKQEKKVKAISS